MKGLRRRRRRTEGGGCASREVGLGARNRASRVSYQVNGTSDYDYYYLPLPMNEVVMTRCSGGLSSRGRVAGTGRSGSCVARLLDMRVRVEYWCLWSSCSHGDGQRLSGLRVSSPCLLFQLGQGLNISHVVMSRSTGLGPVES